MNALDLLNACNVSERKRVALGMEPGGAFLILKVPSPRRRVSVPPETVQVMPGLRGRLIGDGPGYRVVEVATSDARAWVERRGGLR